MNILTLSMSEPVFIKKTPVVIVKNLIIAEFVVTVLYHVAAVLADYGQVYRQFGLSTVLSYELAHLLFTILIEIWLIGFIFMRWYFSYYRIYLDRIESGWGVVWRRKKTTFIARPVSIAYDYGFLSRIFGYGTLVITDRATPQPTVMREVPTPKAYGRQILDQNRLHRNNQPVSFSPVDINSLLASREHEKLEFKSSLRWDLNEKKINRGMEKAVMKTVAAFLNCEGGHLVIGVDDGGQVLGVRHDLVTLQRQDADGFENHFNNVFKDAIGAQFRRFVKLDFHDVAGRPVCLISVAPSVRPVYTRLESDETFYIRTGNSTTALSLSEVASYTKSRFHES